MSRGIWHEAVKAKRKVVVLDTRHDFGQQVCDHLLGDTKVHFHVSKADITASHMVSDLQMPNITQARRIARDMKTRFRIRIECIRFGAREAEESHHVLSV